MTQQTTEALTELAAWHERAAGLTHTMNWRQRDEHLELASKARAALISQPPAPTQQELRAKFEVRINKNEWCTTYALEWDDSINSYDSGATHDAWVGFKAASASLTATAGSTP